MCRKFGALLIILVFLFVAVGAAMAEGNARKGKYLFRKNCRACHVEGGSAQALSPISKTQAQWQSVFETIDQLTCSAEWEKLSEKDRADMYAQLHGHAFDSPSPAKCK